MCNGFIFPHSDCVLNVSVWFIIPLYAEHTILMSDNASDRKYTINTFAQNCTQNNLAIAIHSSKTKVLI